MVWGRVKNTKYGGQVQGHGSLICLQMSQDVNGKSVEKCHQSWNGGGSTPKTAYTVALMPTSAAI